MNLEAFWENNMYTREALMERLREIFQSVAREEVVALREAVESNRFNGRAYYDVESQCGCFYGTLAVIRGMDETMLNLIDASQSDGDGDKAREILSNFLNLPVEGCNRDIIEDFVWSIGAAYAEDTKQAFLGMLDEYLCEE